MSLEIQIPKEITKYEAKLIGPLTTRQTFCSVIGGTAAILANYLCGLVAPDFATGAVVFAAAPFVALGFIKIYEMPFEQFAIGYVKTHILAPQTRKSKIKNQFALIESEINSKPDAKKEKYKKSKKAFK